MSAVIKGTVLSTEQSIQKSIGLRSGIFMKIVKKMVEYKDLTAEQVSNIFIHL